MAVLLLSLTSCSTEHRKHKGTHTQRQREWQRMRANDSSHDMMHVRGRKKNALIQLQFNLISLITYRSNVEYEIELEGSVTFKLSLCNSDMMLFWMQLVRPAEFLTALRWQSVTMLPAGAVSKHPEPSTKAEGMVSVFLFSTCTFHTLDAEP